jgi:hypothetical protein
MDGAMLARRQARLWAATALRCCRCSTPAGAQLLVSSSDRDIDYYKPPQIDRNKQQEAQQVLLHEDSSRRLADVSISMLQHGHHASEKPGTTMGRPARCSECTAARLSVPDNTTAHSQYFLCVTTAGACARSMYVSLADLWTGSVHCSGRRPEGAVGTARCCKPINK